VIISHFHNDHWGGLQVFAGSTILATHATHKKMIPEAKELLLEKQDPSGIERELQETEARLDVETNPNKRHALHSYLTRLGHTLQALPTLDPTIPNQTFDGKIVFHGSQRPATLLSTGKGHTISDCILILPEDRVAFIGDIGFFQSQPFMPYSFPSRWLALLDKMTGWDIETFVPGHGPTGSKDDLALQAKYIQTLEELVTHTVHTGGTVEDALNQILPEPFDNWQAIGSRFEANARALYKRQSRSPQFRR
jgi:cyclase